MCFCRYENLRRKERLNSEGLKPCVRACRGRHLHGFLVWFEELAGELAEDGQVGQVRRCRCLRRLTKLLEHKFYTVPVDHTQTRLRPSKPRAELQRSTDQWIMTTPSRNLMRSPKVRANLLASSLMPVNVWTPWPTPTPPPLLSCSCLSRVNSWGDEDGAGVRACRGSAGVVPLETSFTCCRQSTSAAALSILSTCLLL